MYTRNPYGAAVQGYNSQTSSAAAKEHKSHDAVLSRVPKRPQVSKPPVKFSMAPRYRFAIPDPPTDLKMLRGKLEVSPDVAVQMSKLEYNAKKVAVPLHPSFGLNVDLAMQTQYSPRASTELLPDDQVLLSLIEPRSASIEESPLSNIASSSLKGPSGNAYPSGGQSIGAERVAPPRPSRPKQPVTFPWMRRMSYDEYRSGTSISDARRSMPVPIPSADAVDRKELWTKSRRKGAIESFQSVQSPSITHPDKAKSHLKVVRNIPVYRDLDDANVELISMQFDQFALFEQVTRFHGQKDKAETAFQSAVTISIADDENRKYLSCYLPGGTAPGVGSNEDRNDWYERIREFAMRDSARSQPGSKASQAKSAGQSRRVKRSFVLTVVGDDDESNVALLSEIPSAFLLAPRPGVLPALSKPALELTREADTPAAKRQRLETVVDTLLTSRK